MCSRDPRAGLGASAPGNLRPEGIYADVIRRRRHLTSQTRRCGSGEVGWRARRHRSRRSDPFRQPGASPRQSPPLSAGPRDEPALVARRAAGVVAGHGRRRTTPPGGKSSTTETVMGSLLPIAQRDKARCPTALTQPASSITSEIVLSLRPGEAEARGLSSSASNRRAEQVDLRQRVRVGIAAEEEHSAVADHADRQRVTLCDGNDRVDLFELVRRVPRGVVATEIALSLRYAMRKSATRRPRARRSSKPGLCRRSSETPARRESERAGASSGGSEAGRDTR